MDDDAPRRTVSITITLDVPEQRRGDLHRTNKQFLHCANRTSEWAWRYDDYCITSKSKAEDALYDDLREETASLPTSSRKVFAVRSKLSQVASRN